MKRILSLNITFVKQTVYRNDLRSNVPCVFV